MASVEDHYKNHLASFYEWMLGDFDLVSQTRFDIYKRLGLSSRTQETAIDLGCGHGIDSFALSRLGYKVVALDSSRELLDVLKNRCTDETIVTHHGDLLTFRKYVKHGVLISCMGDTIAHMKSFEDLKLLFQECKAALSQGGKLLLSFRDYAHALTDSQRFIPVRSDNSKIFTCFLEYDDSNVKVTDLIYVLRDGEWELQSSSYTKLRIRSSVVETMLYENGFSLVHREETGRLVYLLAERI